MASTDPRVFKIVPTTQQYDWGKLGREALVAQFAEASKVPGFVVDDSKSYAELWMGTHPSSPSKVKETSEVLSEYLERNQDLIGSSIISKFEDAKSGNLPFLFKVLSIAKALSIQSHPDKETAQKLHEQSPNIYKDPNHKPEMALALTQFQALCGFRPLPQIAQNLRETPELASIIQSAILSLFYSLSSSPTPSGQHEKQALRDLFSNIMTLDEATVRSTVQRIVDRYTSEKLASTDEKGNPNLPDLILRLQSQFPYDIGILCPYVLNYIHLSPGEAIFLGAGEPHAYISGEAIECMANSDNVIRAGLTPKLRDLPNLISGLTYESGGSEHAVVEPKPFNDNKDATSTLYDPPIEEFSVVKVDLSKGASEKHRAVDGPSIAIVTSGNGTVAWSEKDEEKTLEYSEGDIFFIGAGTPVSYSTGQGVALYRAFVEA